MHYVGIDLAWGHKRPTGLAVLDEAGTLIRLTSAISNAEIVAAASAYTSGPCRVGIDAPLVVTNETGNRAAERALNRDFAKFDAGAHPVNRTLIGDTGVPRGAEIAHALQLPITASPDADRGAIEVYPHAATVALFRLGRTLKYKHKTGRSLTLLRAELLTLARLLEGLSRAPEPLRLDGCARWGEVLAMVESAERKSQLRPLEDEIDAVLCAYVALLQHRRPEAVTAYGTPGQDQIITPTLPADLVPTPRPARSREQVAGAVRKYAAQHPHLRVAAADAVTLVRTLLDEAGINYLSVDGRAKSVASFAGKAVRTIDGTPTGSLLYPDPLRQITDTIGVRVITYAHSDVSAVAALLGEELVVRDDRDLGKETASEGRFGYASRHLQVTLSPDTADSYPSIGEREVQVQLRTVLQHAWAEFEHDIRYKGVVPDEHRADFDRRFTLAAGLLELADQEFAEIRTRLQPAETESSTTDPGSDDPRIHPRELAAFLAGQYAEASWSRPDHYEWIAGLVLELGITSLSELAEVIRSVDMAQVDGVMGYRNSPSAVRRLDDALLSVYGDQYVVLHGNTHRVDRLRTRLRRLQPRAE